MKRYTEYTDAQLVTMPKDELEKLIDIECAYAGIELLPEHPGIEPVKPEVKQTMFWSVGGFKFDNSEDANKVYAALTKCKLYDNNWKYGVEYYSLMDSGSYYYPKVTTDKAATEAELDKHKEELTQYDELHKVWKAKNNRYESVLKERQRIIDAVQERITAYWDFQREYNEAISNLERYYELAENNISIALNFYRSAVTNQTDAQVEAENDFIHKHSEKPA